MLLDGINKDMGGAKLLLMATSVYPVDCTCICPLLKTQHHCLCPNGRCNPPSASHPPPPYTRHSLYMWLWFKSYLTNRLQYVSINNCKSGLLQVKSGVPQGSILGPLLFIIYVNDLSPVINNSHILGYADDTKCYKHMVTQFDQQLLQDDLNSLLHWSELVDLSFNPNKCVHICINPKIIQSYFLGDNIIPTRSIQNDLGVAICDNLQWSKHHNNILSKAYKMLGLVRRTFCANVSTMTKTKLYICLIRSQIMYCSILWRPHLIQDFTKLKDYNIELLSIF